MNGGPEPVILTGRHVRLEPLTPAHQPALARHGQEAEIWRYMPNAVHPDPAVSVRTWCEQTLAADARGAFRSFAIIDRARGEAVGGTSYLDISPPDQRVEIGNTWLGAAARRTPVNTECKYLLLRHAFETLGCQRVQLKTDSRNLRSQAAIARIGAQREGVLRNHMILADGSVRDTVMFSIIDAEWPAVKARLEARLGG